MNRHTKIGERLKIERLRLRYSQAEAGNMVGVSDAMWGRYERGAVMGVDVESKLQGAGFDVDYIFTGIPEAQYLQVLANMQLTNDLEAIKQAALQAHKAATAMGKVSDKQFISIFSALLDGVVQADESTAPEDKNNKQSIVTQTSNSSGTVQIGGNNTGAIGNAEGGKRK